MSDQLPSLDAINHLLFDDASVIHPELRDLMHLYVSGRLVDREAIDYGNADSEIADQTDEIRRGDRVLYDPIRIIAAAIGDTPSTVTSADWFNRDDNI